MSENQYIRLVETKPDRLLACSEGTVPGTAKEWVGRRLVGMRGVMVELGSGSGGHLIDYARLNPTTACIGFELRFKRAFRTIEKAEAAGAGNCAVVRSDARLLHEFFEPGSIDDIFVNFPDPWSKRRWHKHRLLSEQFFGRAHALLKDGGHLHYKTDHPEYFERTVALAGTLPGWNTTGISRDLPETGAGSFGNVLTEFERLFRRQGLPIHALHLRKMGV